MQYFLEGLFFGLSLTVSMGPIFVALTQTSIEKGFWPGVTCGIGVWSSDIIIISLFLYLVNMIKDLVASHTFNLIMGVGGGIVMMIIGVALLFYKSKIDYSSQSYSAKSYLGFWLKGFLVNTLNPFTHVFWMLVITTYVFGRGISTNNTIIFLSTIMAVIIISDLMKVGLASYIRDKMTDAHMRKATIVAGVFMVVFGLAFMIRAF